MVVEHICPKAECFGLWASPRQLPPPPKTDLAMPDLHEKIVRLAHDGLSQHRPGRWTPQWARGFGGARAVSDVASGAQAALKQP